MSQATFVAAVVAASYGVVILSTQLRLHLVMPAFPGQQIVTRLPHLVPYLVPLLVLRPSLAFSWAPILLAVALGGALLISQHTDIRLALSREVLALQGPIPLEGKLVAIETAVGSAIFQELFYRVFIIDAFRPLVGVVAILLSVATFVLEHPFQASARSNYDRRGYIYMIMLALGLSIIYYVTRSYWACIAGHLLFVLPATLARCLRPAPRPGTIGIRGVS